MTVEDRYEINEAAERDGMTPSEWARRILLEAVAQSRLIAGLPIDERWLRDDSLAAVRASDSDPASR